jgi:hypothetical protein
VDDFNVIFIASARHSGSTLLDQLVAAHSRAVTVGEIAKLAAFANLAQKSRFADRSNRCTCGAANIFSCDFWRRIESRLVDVHGPTFALRELDLMSDNDDTFVQHNRALFQAIAAETGAALIIDSSKGVNRLARLIQLRPVSVTPIYLRRAPFGQVYSCLKRSPTIGLRWLCTEYNRHAYNASRALRKHRRLVVRYEDLAANPEALLRRLMPELGLTFEPAQLEFDPAATHALAGNRMRFEPNRQVKLDDEWRRGLSSLQKLAIGGMTLGAVVTTRLRLGRS